MPATLYSNIRLMQEALFAKQAEPLQLGAHSPPAHNPDVLLIGCIDARLNPKDDIGIPDGKALIHRNIAALVPANDENNSTTQRLSVAATLEFAIKKMHIKKIVVMGHTHCGGIMACVAEDHKDDDHIREYLKPLEAVRLEAVDKGETLEQQARDMEKAAVLQSLENLKSYELVREALSANPPTVALGGWIIDTHTKLIWELNQQTGSFSPMGAPQPKV